MGVALAMHLLLRPFFDWLIGHLAELQLAERVLFVDTSRTMHKVSSPIGQSMGES
jgi:hypothetical protein